MEKAKMIELAIGVAGIVVVLVIGYLFARHSDRAAQPKAYNK